MDGKRTRELAALVRIIAQGDFSRAPHDRLMELTGMSYADLTSAARFADVVLFAHQDGKVVHAERLDDEKFGGMLSSFDEFEARHQGAACEMFGTAWEWETSGSFNPGTWQCIQSRGRPTGVPMKEIVDRAVAMSDVSEPSPGMNR